MAAAARHPPYPFPVSVGGCDNWGRLVTIRHCGSGMSEGRRADATSRDVDSAGDGLLTAGSDVDRRDATITAWRQGVS